MTDCGLLRSLFSPLSYVMTAVAAAQSGAAMDLGRSRPGHLHVILRRHCAWKGAAEKQKGAAMRSPVIAKGLPQKD